MSEALLLFPTLEVREAEVEGLVPSSEFTCWEVVELGLRWGSGSRPRPDLFLDPSVQPCLLPPERGLGSDPNMA